jgi:hypothetical protein
MKETHTSSSIRTQTTAVWIYRLWWPTVAADIIQKEAMIWTMRRKLVPSTVHRKGTLKDYSLINLFA